MEIGDTVKVQLNKKTNGRANGEKKFLQAKIVKLNNKTAHVRLSKGNVIVKRFNEIVEV